MSLPPDFWETLPQKTDIDLYEMLAHPDDYLPEALAAAKEELRKRNLPPEQSARLEKIVESEKVEENAKARIPLSWPMRILIFLLCFGLLGIVLALYYDSKGFKHKARDCWVTMGVSVVAHLLFSFLAVLHSSR
jgi:hypothetical protein